MHPETGEIINKDRLILTGLSKARFILKEGNSLGDVYTQSDLLRNNNGHGMIDDVGAITVTYIKLMLSY